MLGRLDPAVKEATVVGAGISGLLAAYRLVKRGYLVTLHEAKQQSGGLLKTTRSPHGISERAAHSFLASPAVTRLCGELGVPLVALNRKSRARYIFRDGRPRRMPLGPIELGRTLSKLLWAKAGTGISNGMPDETPDETLESWGLRHLGEPALRNLLTPFVQGIYGARPGEIGVQAAFPSLVVPLGKTLFEHLRARLWLERGKPRKLMMAPQFGMSSLVERLEEVLAGELRNRFIRGHALQSLPPCANLILAVPAGEASRLLEAESPQTARALRNVRYAPMASITIIARNEDFAFGAPRGVGVLVPEHEGRDCLGILFNSSSFEGRVEDPERCSSFTVMLGGTLKPRLIEKTDAELLEIARRELFDILHLRKPELWSAIHRWPRAIPLYEAGIAKVWEICQTQWCSRPGRIIFGNYTGQVSLRGLIESSEGFS